MLPISPVVAGRRWEVCPVRTIGSPATGVGDFIDDDSHGGRTDVGVNHEANFGRKNGMETLAEFSAFGVC